ncbi:MAG: Holliday junction branch migration protein RuvA [Lachnospiraceae bacterium]|nr:Holliday junction branch migration protein RuvA [Lachnospiraceae bacterium]
MLSYLKGLYTENDIDTITVECGGVGYRVYVPVTALPHLPAIGGEVKIYTYFKPAEDCFSIYGFIRKDDLNVFKQLIKVSGVGPKVAMAILGTLSADDLRFAVAAEDDKSISKAPGVGTKIAKKIVLELKDKLGVAVGEVSSEGTGVVPGIMSGNNALNNVRSDALEALTTLGYTSAESLKAISKVEFDENTPVEILIKMALREM